MNGLTPRARQEAARAECRADGHDFDVITTVTMADRAGEPIGIRCERCRETWDIAPRAASSGAAMEERWTSVFYRYQRELEETHASLEDALVFLHDGWCTAERSPKAIKGPDGQVVMDADQIAADRQNRAATQ